MPSTAKELGVKNPYDAEQNIMGGAKLIAAHLKKFNGNVRYALAAYNAGKRWQLRGTAEFLHIVRHM